VAQVLIVEDDALIGRGLARLLRAQAASTVVDTVSAATHALETAPWTALVVDLALPDGSGFDVLERARARGIDAPALVVTGNVEPHVINRAASLGARFVCKPCGKDELSPFLAEVRAREATAGRARIPTVSAHVAARWGFSQREREIFEFALAGRTRDEYLSSTRMSENTYKTHVKALLRKCDYASLASLALDALRERSPRRVPS
jgi:DNA-binding NarL/FixJ family response regulator